MIVIAHQAVRMATPIELPDHLAENFQEVLDMDLTSVLRKQSRFSMDLCPEERIRRLTKHSPAALGSLVF